MDSVAKIVLSDWVRGRIPFFVNPPERTEELNVAEDREAKIKSKNDVKGKSKAKEERVPSVKQNLGSIMQKNTFVPEDVKPLEDEFTGEVGDNADEGDAGSGDDAPSGGEEEEEELSWNDVFTGVSSKEEASPSKGLPPLPYHSRHCSTVTLVPSEGESEKNDAKKEARMKTNKVSLACDHSSSLHSHPPNRKRRRTSTVRQM